MPLDSGQQRLTELFRRYADSSGDIIGRTATRPAAPAIALQRLEPGCALALEAGGAGLILQLDELGEGARNDACRAVLFVGGRRIINEVETILSRFQESARRPSVNGTALLR